MSYHQKRPFSGNASLKALTIVAAMFAFVMPGQAQQGQPPPPPPCSTQVTLGWTIVNPDPSDRRQIEDLLSLYAWTIDDRTPTPFVNLFDLTDPSTYYEYCNSGGNKQVFKLTPNNQNLASDLTTQMTIITDELKAQQIQTRHLVTNTLFGLDPETKAVITKSTVLVTIQSFNLAAPDLDYTADVRATYVIKNGTWRFKNLTVYADNAPPTVKKR
jgi:hypothetical protein